MKEFTARLPLSDAFTLARSHCPSEPGAEGSYFFSRKGLAEGGMGSLGVGLR